MKKEKNKREGFVILIAVLLAVVFSLIGASIFSISLKELVLSSGGKDSQFAFYAADSGADCALYWDLKYNKFATSTYSVAPTNLNCSEQNVTNSPTNWVWGATVDGQVTDLKHGGTIFGFDLYPGDSFRNDCVIVSVLKTKKDNGTYSTKIISRGYNTCEPDSSRRVERAVEINY